MTCAPTAGLEVRELSCIRGERLVFEKVSFCLAPGHTMRLAGCNGSGKTSLLRLLAGLMRPARGTVLWDGAPLSRESAGAAILIGHLEGIKPWLSVQENLTFWTALREGSRTAVPSALDRLGLAHLHDMPARFLSAGQRRRLALARLAAVPVPLWLLDEPATGLDDASIVIIEDLLAEHAGAGGVAVVATHQAMRLPLAETLDLSPEAAALIAA